MVSYKRTGKYTLKQHLPKAHLCHYYITCRKYRFTYSTIVGKCLILVKTLLYIYNNIRVVLVSAKTNNMKKSIYLGWYITTIISVLFISSLKSQYGSQVDTTRYEKKKKGLEDILHYDEKGNIRGDLYRRSVAEFQQVQVGTNSFLGGTTDWEQIGPSPATVNSYLAGNGQMPGPNGAAIIDMVIDPSGSGDDTLYAISNDGGVWKTKDGGNLWIPKTDKLATLSFGALVLDPANPRTIYAGTGNIFNNGYVKALGIYVSNNGGDSWSLTAGSSVLNDIMINKMVMPSSGTILVATASGLFRSTNSGGTYSRVTIDGRTNDYITDLDIKEDGSVIWACVNGRGIFKSTDGGATFGSNLWGSGHGEVPTSSYGFVSLGVSLDGQSMYANAGLNPSVGVWKSTDGGANWTDISANATVNVPGLSSWRQVANCQCGYDQTMGVDPSNANRVYMGFQDLWLSEDGGSTWTDVSYSHDSQYPPYSKELMHVDHHALVFSPASHRVSGQNTKIWVGNDGGIWSSTTNGTSWENHNADQSANPKMSFANNLFRGIDTGRGATNNNYTYGGMQDTGTAVGKGENADDPTKPQPWNEWGGGDGGKVAVDWQNPQYAYGMWGSIMYTHDGGGSYNWSNVSCLSGSASSFGCLESGPTDRSVYLGGKCSGTPTIFRSTDYGANFSSYYQFTSRSGKVSSIAVSPADANTMYVSLSDKSVHKVVNNNGSISSTDISISGAISNQVPTIAVNQSNIDLLVAVYAGYSQSSLPQRSKHVFFSQDGGTNWSDISGTIPNASIPDMPIYSAVFDPNTVPNSILVSSDLGVFRSYDFGLTWHVLGDNLPHVHTVDLEIDGTVNPSLVKAGTYGRSTWGASLPVGDKVFGQFSSKFLNVGNMTWQNNTNEALDIFWVSQDGTEHKYGTINGGTSVASGPMYFTGVTVVRDQSGNIVLSYIINGNANQVVAISQESLNIAKQQVLQGYPGLRSFPSQGKTVSNFPVYNNSSQTLNLNWITTNGLIHKIGSLAPNANTSVVSVYYGGTFTLSDQNGKVLAFYVATDAENQSFVITDDLINSWN